VSQRTATALLAVLTLAVTEGAIHVRAQQPQAQQAQNDEIVRRAKFKVQPAYPALARKMNISGVVKIEVVVAPNGSVKDARVVGGHPVLAGVLNRLRAKPPESSNSSLSRGSRTLRRRRK
jgi:outer membrane biosynthesis protein TonB